MTTNVIEVVINATSNAASAFGSVADGLGRVTGAAVTGGLALAGAAVSAGYLIQRFNEMTEKTTDAAAQIGITVEQLSKLEYAAKISNVEVDGLHKSLTLLNKNVSEAADNGGAAANALAEIGLSAAQLNRLDADQKLAVIADAMQSVGNTGDKTRIAMDLFGRSGAQMLRLMEDGAGQLAELAAEAQRLGVVLDTQTAANAQQLGDAFDRVTSSISATFRAVVNEAGPLLSGVLNRFSFWLGDNRQAIAEWTDKAITGFLAVLIVARNVMTVLMVWGERLWVALGGGQESFLESMAMVATFGVRTFANFIVWLATNFAKLAGFIGQSLVGAIMGFTALAAGALQTTFAFIVDLATVVGKRILDALAGNVVEPLGKQMSDAWSRAMVDIEGRTHDTMQGLGDFATSTWDTVATTASEAWESITGTLDTVSSVLSDLGKEFGDAIDLDAVLAEVDLLREKLEVVGEAQQGAAEAASERLSVFFDTWREKSQEFLVSHKSMTEEIAGATFDLMMNTSAAIGDAFAQSLVAGRGLGKALEAVGKQVLTSLVSMLIRIGIQRLILSKIIGTTAMTENAALLAGGMAQVFTNAFAATAAIPIVGPILAPGVAAASLAAAMGGATAAAAAGATLGVASGVGGVAHGGMDYVPSESTFLLQRGERVLSPRQNEDLTGFLDGKSSSNEVNINLNVSDDWIGDGPALRRLARSLDTLSRKNGVRIRSGRGGE